MKRKVELQAVGFSCILNTLLVSYIRKTGKISWQGGNK